MLEQRWPLLIADALTEIYSRPDSSSFLQWMMDNVARYFDDDVFPIENQAIRSTGLQLGVAIWSATPQPGNDFECTPITLPNPNHFCPCGSGKQYKNCCAHAPMVPALDAVEVFSIAAAQMPQKIVFELAEKQPPSTYMLFLVARVAYDLQMPKKAVQFLEPRFQTPKNLEIDDGDLLDLLLECYELLRMERKKQVLLLRLFRDSEGPFRGHLLQRMAAISADQGYTDQAWQYFREAQRELPNDVGLIHLELVLLMSENKRDEAVQRARFWSAWAKRNVDADHVLHEQLAQMIKNPVLAMLDMGSISDSHWELELHNILQLPVDNKQCHAFSVERKQAHIRRKTWPKMDFDRWEELMSAMDSEHMLGGFGFQKQMWNKFFAVDEDSTDGLQLQMIYLLQDCPSLRDNYEVLFDLFFKIQDHPAAAAPWVAETLWHPWVERSWKVASRLLDDIPDNVSCPYSVKNNQSFLHFLWEIAGTSYHTGNPARMEICCNAILKLDPEDNFGAKGKLMNFYLQNHENAKALQLLEKFPVSKMLELVFGGVLLYFRLNQLEKAEACLRRAHEQEPLVMKYLLAASPKPPKGVDHLNLPQHYAFRYRQQMGDACKNEAGFMEWAKKIVRSKRA